MNAPTAATTEEDTEAHNNRKKDYAKETATTARVETKEEFLEQEESEPKKIIHVDGYFADVSSASKSGSNVDSANDSFGGEDKLGLVIEITPRNAKKAKDHRSIRRHRNQKSPSHSITHSSVPGRKRKRRDNRITKHSKRRPMASLPAPSPIHPEIDISLTQHISIKTGLLYPTTDAVLQGAIVSHGVSSHDRSQPRQNDAASSISPNEIASCVPALSNAVLQYFSELRHEIAASSRKNTRRKRSTTETKPCNVPVSESQKDTIVREAAAQVISDIASFSDQPYQLEDALEITDTPRLLLEGTTPHRVIHVNAAFLKQIIMAGGGRQQRQRFHNNAQEWIESQNQLSVRNEHRSLQKAIEDIIPDNAALPLACHPVLGSSNTTSHYLVEAALNTAKADPNQSRHHDTMKLYRPFEAIG